MSGMLSGMNRLRALWYRENGTNQGRSSWGQGGASSFGRSQRYAKAINKGLSPNDAAKAAYGSHLGNATHVSRGSAPNDKQLLHWANNSGDPEVRQVMMAMRKSSNVGGKFRKTGPMASESVLDKLLKETQKQFDEYVNATESRYEEIKGDLKGREKQAVEELRKLRSRVGRKLEGYGDAQETKLEQDFAESLANTTQNLRAQGLGSIAGAYEGRNAFDLALAKGLLGDRIVDREIAQDAALTQGMVDAQARLSGDTASFMERRNDIPPDMSMIAQLANQYGRGNAGRGFMDGRGVGMAGGGGGAYPQNRGAAFVNPAAFMPMAMMGSPMMPQGGGGGGNSGPRMTREAQLRMLNGGAPAAANAAAAAAAIGAGAAGGMAGLLPAAALAAMGMGPNQQPARRGGAATPPAQIPTGPHDTRGVTRPDMPQNWGGMEEIMGAYNLGRTPPPPQQQMPQIPMNMPPAWAEALARYQPRVPNRPIGPDHTSMQRPHAGGPGMAEIAAGAMRPMSANSIAGLNNIMGNYDPARANWYQQQRAREKFLEQQRIQRLMEEMTRRMPPVKR